MYRGHTVAVIVPAYNEEEHIEDVLTRMPDFVDRIYAIDDRSTDDTWAIIQKYAAISDPPSQARDTSAASSDEANKRHEVAVSDGGTAVKPTIIPIRHERNQGAGGALRTGYLRARDDGLDIAVTMDADGQMDPDQLPKLLDPIVEGAAGFTKGNRLADRSSRRKMPPFRLFGNWLLTQLTKFASGYWDLQDPQNGYTAISQTALSSVDIESIPNDHDYPNDLLVRLNIADVRIADVSMPAVYDDEDSTIQYRTFIPTTSITLLRGFLQRMRTQFASDQRDPTVHCYGAGVTALTIATIVAATSGIRVVTGEAPSQALLATILLFGVGIGAIVTGMWMDARDNADLGVRR